MRTKVAMVVAAVVLLAVFTVSDASARSSTKLPRATLVPNAVAFDTRSHGVLGTGWDGCVNRGWHCRLQGTISVTSNGGETWRVVLRTRQPVIALAFFHDSYYAQLLDGKSLWSDTEATRWRQLKRLSFDGYCPKGWNPGYTAEFVDTNIGTPWSICARQPGVGNEAKAVYRGKKRVTFTPMTGRGHGGISSYGYPSGIAGTHGGFGIIWESRGTLYVTHDGGHRWHALPKVARPEVDFGQWADTGLGAGTAFVVLAIGDSERRRLIETTNAGRTWHVVHRWRGSLTP
jgi:hypothetical protein